MNALARLLLSMLVALAVLPAGTSPAHAAGNHIHGTVTIAGDTTTPVNGTFSAKPVGASSYSGWWITNGAFSTSGLADGDYRFLVRIETMDGFVRWYKEGVAGGVALEADADVFQVTAASDLELDWELPQIATLSGTVTDEAGNAVTGAPVSMNRMGMGRSTTTDGNGAYSLGYVLPGPVSLYAHGTEGLAGAGAQITLPASGSVIQDFVLPTKGVIEGTVTDATSGDPIPYIEVAASSNVAGDTGLTDADGHFSLLVDPGDFVLRFDDREFESYVGTYNDGAATYDEAPRITVGSGETVVHDEALTAKPDPRDVEHSLGGVVTAAGGAPLGGIAITASHGDETFTTTTDRWGRWALGSAGSLLPDGAYLLRAEQGWRLDNLHPDLVPWFPEYYPNAWTAAQATQVTLAGVTQDGLDMTLERAARLAVTVSASGTGALHTGYRVLTPAGAVAADVPATTSSPASPSILLRPGTWKILASGFRGDTAPGTRLLPKWLGGGVSLATAGSFTVASGQKLATSVTLPSALKVVTNPKIKGTPRVGRTLTATKGTWNLMTGTTFTYTWYRGTKVIGRTAAHVVVRADRGRTLKVRVTAVNGTFRTTVTRKIQVP